MNLHATIVFILKTHADGRFGHEGICDLLVIAGVTISSDLVRDIMAKLPAPQPADGDFELVYDVDGLLKAFQMVAEDVVAGYRADETLADLREMGFDWTPGFVAGLRKAQLEWALVGNDKSWTG